MLQPDEEDYLLQLKQSTDENGLLQAWITDIDLNKSQPTVSIKTSLGDTYTKTYEHPSTWSTDFDIVQVLEQTGIEPETADEVSNLEVRFNPNSEEITTVGSIPDFDGTSLSDAAREYRKLKDQTINTNWIKAKITNISFDTDNAYLMVNIPNYGEVQFKYDRPESWDSQYTIIDLCERLGVSSSEELTGEYVAIGQSSNLVSLQHTQYSGRGYSHDLLPYQNHRTGVILAPVEFATNGIPERETTEDPETDSNGVEPIVGVILMVAISVILAAILTSFILGLGDTLSMDNAVTVTDEGNGAFTVTHNQGYNQYDIIIKEDGEVIGTIDEMGESYVYTKSDNAEHMVVYTEDNNGYVFHRERF